MRFLSENTGSFTTGRFCKVRRLRGRSRIARLLGVALGVSGLVGIATTASVLSVASTAAAMPPPNEVLVIAGCISVLASGAGTVGVSIYASDPVAQPPTNAANGLGASFAVSLSQQNTFTSLNITDSCILNPVSNGQSFISESTPTGWVPISTSFSPGRSASSPCLSVILSRAQLIGLQLRTVFAVVTPAEPESPAPVVYVVGGGYPSVTPSAPPPPAPVLPIGLNL